MQEISKMRFCKFLESFALGWFWQIEYSVTCYCLIAIKF